MQHTFIHKLILSILAGLALASIVQFYKTFVIGADRAMNEGYNTRYGISK